jgi:hypothetical protein
VAERRKLYLGCEAWKKIATGKNVEHKNKYFRLDVTSSFFLVRKR